MSTENAISGEAGMSRQRYEPDGHGGKQATPADVTRAPQRQTHDRPPDLEKKIGKTTYRVWVHFSQTSKETPEDKIKRMLRDDVRRAMQGGY